MVIKRAARFTSRSFSPLIAIASNIRKSRFTRIARLLCRPKRPSGFRQPPRPEIMSSATETQSKTGFSPANLRTRLETDRKFVFAKCIFNSNYAFFLFFFFVTVLFGTVLFVQTFLFANFVWRLNRFCFLFPEINLNIKRIPFTSTTGNEFISYVLSNNKRIWKSSEIGEFLYNKRSEHRNISNTL